jgi:hypothetical protein
MAPSTRPQWGIGKEGLREWMIKIRVAGGIRVRPSKAKLRKQLKDPERKKRMQAYRWLRYRLQHGMR